MSFIRHASHNTIAHSVSALLLLLAGVVTARFLGPEGRGVYAVFFTTAGLMSQLLYFGLSQANVYYLNREKRSYNEILGNSVLFLLGQGVLFAFILTVFNGPVSSLFPDSPVALILCLLWGAALLQTGSEIYSGLLLGRHLFGLYAINTFLIAVGVFVTAFAAYWYPDNVENVILARVVVFVTIVVAFFTVIVVRTKPEFQVSMKLFKEQLNFGLKNYIQNVVGTLNYRLYLLLLSVMSGNTTAGLFSVAMLFVEPIRLLPDSVGPVLLSYLSSEHDGEVHKRMTAKACRMILWLVFLGMIFYIPLAPYLLYYVFGESYMSALGTIWIMMVGGFVGVVFQILTRHFTSLHLQRYTIKSSLFALLVAVVSSMILIPTYGTIGAGISYVCSSFTAMIFIVFYFNQTTGVSVRDLLLIKKQDVQDGYALVHKFLISRVGR